MLFGRSPWNAIEYTTTSLARSIVVTSAALTRLALSSPSESSTSTFRPGASATRDK
jgi:hypothetical protein